MSDTTTTRQAILKAANRIVQRDGVARLTIEAVAREAGLSKGGVLYHFASKDTLIQGMVTFLLEQFEHDIANAQAKEPSDANQWLRAYVLATCYPEQPDNEAENSLIAAIANNPALLQPVRERYMHWQQRVEQSGLPPALATIIRLAADGLWLADMLALAPPTGELREAVVAELLKLAGPPDKEA